MGLERELGNALRQEWATSLLKDVGATLTRTLAIKGFTAGEGVMDVIEDFNTMEANAAARFIMPVADPMGARPGSRLEAVVRLDLGAQMEIPHDPKIPVSDDVDMTARLVAALGFRDLATGDVVMSTYAGDGPWEVQLFDFRGKLRGGAGQDVNNWLVLSLNDGLYFPDPEELRQEMSQLAEDVQNALAP